MSIGMYLPPAASLVAYRQQTETGIPASFYIKHAPYLRDAQGITPPDTAILILGATPLIWFLGFKQTRVDDRVYFHSLLHSSVVNAVPRHATLPTTTELRRQSRMLP